MTSMTHSMSRAIDLLQAEFGGTVEITMIDGKAWATGRNNARPASAGNTWQALITSSCSMEFTIYRLGNNRTAANLHDALGLL